MALEIDGTRLHAEIDALARISDDPFPAVTRVLFTDVDVRGRAWLAQRFAEAGLDIRRDAVGNTFARWVGEDPEASAVATGSHVDAIPQAGRFDGVVGVLGGLEAIRALKRAGVRARRSIELVVFTAEEPTRFGIGCLGSRAMAGMLDPDRLAGLRDADGLDLETVRATAGVGGDLASVAQAPGAYAAFVELHIEQGPILEREGVDIGAVTAIAAPATLRVRLRGPGGHAGGVLMRDRHDPLLAAAQVVQAAEQVALATCRPDTVATVGLLQVQPGAVNSIARDVLLEIDVRDTDRGARDGVLEVVTRVVREVSAARGVKADVEVVNADPPATCDPGIVDAIERAAAGIGATSRRMVSRAYHDSLFMSLLAPTAMVFIPCRDGVSHRPDEHSSPEAVEKGVRVLAEVLRELAGEAPAADG